MISIVIASPDEVKIFKGNRFGLGGYMETSKKRFDTQTINYNDGDMLYLFSDGYKDQFGGAKNKKFMSKRLLTLFEQIHHLPAAEQHREVTNTFNNWKGKEKQVDDILVMGLRL